AWASSGNMHEALLKAMSGDTYFKLPPPKSTGREYFNLQWLEQHLATFNDVNAADVQASLCELTASSIADAIQAAENVTHVIVCGGGARNTHLLGRISALLPNASVAPASEYGINEEYVEAAAFAWLARETLAGRAGNIIEVTGAEKKCVLGAIYPADSELT
ncbi:MAG: anhydro-N-acetylmuramic acid kinase, partial [Gammaproteobacteria bacterium]|nr:anhydro-N-acetylmuramic acid kinase [Gammaproteobacteria bacterium]